MSKLEKFGLITGIVGLVADSIALATFLSGIWSPKSPNSTPGELPPIYGVILALTIAYGWVATTWALVRRSSLTRKLKSAKQLLITTFNATLGIGLILLPLTMAWWAAISQIETTPTDKTIKATQTIQTPLTPTTTSTHENQTQPTSTSYTDPMGVMVCAPITHITAGAGIFLAVLLLMPLAYPDMPSPEEVLRTIFEIMSSTEESKQA